MRQVRTFLNLNHEFWHYFWKYGEAVLIVQVIINLILAPILTWITNGILDLGQVSYLSYTNILDLCVHKPLVILGLLLVLILILLLVFGQFALLLVSFQAIRSQETVSWRHYLKTVLHKIFRLPFQAFGFFFLYFLLIIPIGSIGVSSNLLDKVTVPEFIRDWLITDHLPLAILLLIVYLIAFYIGIRWLFVIPFMIFEDKSVRVAMRQSWQLTRHQWLQYIGLFVILALVLLVATQVIFGIILGGQWLFDHIPGVRFATAILNLTLVQILNFCASIYATAISLLLILSQTKSTYHYSYKTQKKHLWFWIGFATVALLSFGSYSVAYFQNWLTQRPETISHRGVDDGNGVQNSIDALKKTAKLKPTYVEMDVQETKDHQFVVYHDKTLKKLAGINKKPSDLTLQQLTQTKIYENGQTAYIAGFDDYLATANKIDQKLLVEFKAVKGNRAHFVKRFAHKYGRQLQKNHGATHSLSYNYVQESKRYMPKIPANYVLSFNLSGVPKSAANAFTMEHTTLNSTFVNETHLQGKKVYAWTVNDTTAMDQMIFLDVDGIVTDNMTSLKQEIKNNFDKKTYAGRILNYYLQMQNPF